MSVVDHLLSTEYVSFLLTVAAAMLAAFWFHARTGAGPGRVAVFGVVVLSVAAIVSLTLLRFGLPQTFSLEDAVHWTPGGWRRFVSDFASSEEIRLNVALFLPAGLVLSLWSRRPLAVLGVLIVLSATIEFLQGLLGIGTADVSDLASNSVGAFLGVTAGALVLGVLHSARRRTHLATSAAMVALAVAAVVARPTLAQRHLNATVRDVTAQFRSRTIQDYNTWQAEGGTSLRALDVDGIYPDGIRSHVDQVTLRYPASFFGHTQCVEAVWTARGVTAHGVTGHRCGVFWG